MIINKKTQRTLTSRLFALSFLLSVSSISCSSGEKGEGPIEASGWTVSISGKVGFPQQGRITIQEIKGGTIGWQDTINLKSNYTYTKKVTLSEPGYYKINFYNRQVVDFILYKNNIEINVDGNDQNGFVQIIGSPELDLIYKAQAIVQQTEGSPELNRINEEFTKAAQVKNEDKMAELREAYYKHIHDQVATLIRSQPVSLGTINLLQNNIIDRDNYLDTYVFVAEKAKKEWPNSDHVKQFVGMVNQMKVTAIGQIAPEIALPDTTGQIVKLSSLRGKYVLVDFWAKWCGPCRMENPNVVRVFHKYKDKGFTVFGVSLDRNKQDWLKAIAEDKLTWTHVSDLKYWQSEAAKTYNITAIPFSLLVDPNGVIIAKNLRGKALENKLAEIFNQKPK